MLGKAIEREYNLLDLLRRPNVTYDSLMGLTGTEGQALAGPGIEEGPVREQVEIQVKYAGYIARQANEISRQESCDIRIDPISTANVAPMDSNLQTYLTNSAEALGLSHSGIASGAGHDMAHMSRIAPAAMIFIPCKDRLSHCPEEFATPEAIARGSAVLTHTVLMMASRGYD